MRIGVTGLTSEIGCAVHSQALARGYLVEGLGRRPGQRRFEIRADLDPEVLAELDGLIHLAWDRSSARGMWGALDPNVACSSRPFRACAEAGVPVSFLSSSAAGQPNKSRYGAAKRQVETVAAELGFPSLRAGLIWGGGLPPILQTLKALANTAPFLLLPTPAMVLDHNHESYVADGLLRSLSVDPVTPLRRSLASPELVTSTEVLMALRSPNKGVVVPVPSRLIARTARAIRRSRLLTTSKLDSAALLDTSGKDLDLDPEYPEGFGRAEFLAWLSTKSST